VDHGGIEYVTSGSGELDTSANKIDYVFSRSGAAATGHSALHKQWLCNG
jgi:hypothetical protein